ncbi:MAG TPA: efflux RND transporter permease subunit, partial [Arenibaculum sp.]|nr:efflux RND transporter permease subunit [Arenibaculum sp.]
MTRQQTAPDGGFFWTVIRLRWLILLIGILAIAGTGINLPKLVKDTTAGAFIDPENPALLYRERVEDLFGLRDPIVVAVVARGEDGIYTPATLDLVAWLTERIGGLGDIDPERVVSLATESNVVGTNDGMEVEKFFDTPPGTPGRAAWIRDAIADFPLYQGNLVARDGTATMIVAELLDEDLAEPAFEAIEALTREAPVPPGTEIYIAGESAVAGYLSSYIDRDAARLNPMAGLIITLVLFAAFRTLRGALVPNLVVLATVAITLGTMAAAGIPFYIITNGLIVCLIGISIADSIHVFSTFYDLRRSRPDLGKQELIVRVMQEKWRPILLTSLTTIAGFLALWPTNDMPPIRYCGLFGARGVAVALVYTEIFLPALLAIL